MAREQSSRAVLTAWEPKRTTIQAYSEKQGGWNERSLIVTA